MHRRERVAALDVWSEIDYSGRVIGEGIGLGGVGDPSVSVYRGVAGWSGGDAGRGSSNNQDGAALTGATYEQVTGHGGDWNQKKSRRYGRSHHAGCRGRLKIRGKQIMHVHQQRNRMVIAGMVALGFVAALSPAPGGGDNVGISGPVGAGENRTHPH